MTTPVALYDFQSLALPYRKDQAAALDWLASAHVQSDAGRPASAAEPDAAARAHRLRRRVLRYGSATRRIRFRHTAVEDFLHTDWDKMRIYPLRTSAAGAGCGERNQLFAEVAGDAFERFYAEDDAGPDALLHVTCTGYVSPSGAQQLVARRGWCGTTEVLHVYHMGCYAALPGLRIAAGLLATGKHRVDLVHTELCTLHLDPSDHAPEQLVAQALFADGMIRYSVADTAGDSSAMQGVAGSRHLVLRATREELVPGTEGEMGWALADHGMRITLARTVAERIRPALAPYLERLAAAARIDPRALRERAIFAVHPGGPKIIDQVGAALGLREDQLAASNAILEAHGNMSSATLPHIWQALLDDPDVAPGTHVVSLAFGPGLTLSGAVLSKRAGA